MNTATGEFWHTFADLTVPGRGPAVDLTRTYSSNLANVDGPFGFGWSSPYGMHLQTDDAGNIDVDQENGSVVEFIANGDGTYSPSQPRELATLAVNGDGNYVFTRKARQSFTFDPSGRLIAISDLDGNTTTLSYDSSGDLSAITDPAGRAVSVTMSGGLITSVTDVAGRTVRYGYDGNDNLTSVTDPTGAVWSYGYDVGHLLTSMLDPDQQGAASPQPLTNTYDDQGRVISQTDFAGRTTTFAYTGDNLGDAGGSTTVIDPRGDATTYDYVDGLKQSQTTGAGTPDAATTTYTYDPNLFAPIQVTDPDGHISKYSYDTAGNLLTATDPLGRITTYTYDSLDDVTSVTDATGVTSTYTYDGNGNLTGESTPLAGSAPPQVQATGYTYGDSHHPGDLTAVTDPDGNTWTYAYDASGDLTSATTPLGKTTTYGYDAVGERISMVTPAGNVSGADPAAHRSTYSYDGDGRPLDATSPATASAPGGASTTTGYDADGNPVRTVDADGNVTVSSYDADGELVSRTTGDGTAAAATDSFSYDADGNRTCQAVGQPACHAGSPDTTVYDYTDAAYPSAVTEQTTPATAAAPGGATTTSSYDAAGRLTATTNPRGQTTSYDYDAAGEPTAVDYSAADTPDVSYGYDADGRRKSMTDGTGTTSYRYDSLGRLTASTDGAGLAVGYGYDLAGNETSVTYPNGHTVSYGYDIDGDTRSASDWLGHTTTFGYDPDANLTTENLPNGITQTSTFDNADQLTAMTAADGSTGVDSFTYGRDPNGQVTSETTTGAPGPAHQDYGYDQRNRLTSDQQGAYRYTAADDPTQLSNGVTQTFDDADELTSTTSVATISRVATGTATDLGTAASLTATLSAPAQPGDQILVEVVNSALQSVTTPAGFTQVGAWTDSLRLERTTVYRRTATVTTGGVTVGFGLGVLPKAMAVAVYSGVDPTTPIDTVKAASADTTTATTISVAALASSHDGEQLVALSSEATSVLPATGFAFGCGLTSRAQSFTLASLAGVAVADATQDKAGSVGPCSVSLQTATGTGGPGVSQLTTVLLALKPAVVTTGYTYNADGDRTGAGLASYSYDQADRLTGYDSATVSASYTYNGDGLRTASTVNAATSQAAWNLSGGLPLQLTDGTTSYVYGPGGLPLEQISSSGTVLYYLHDQAGSTRTLTTQSGAVAGSFTYTPYGQLLASTGTATSPFTWQGQYQDPADGLYYLRARYYDPSTGQLFTRDPLEALTGQPYAYAGEDPLDASDPSGLEELGDGGTLGCLDCGSPVIGMGPTDYAPDNYTRQITGETVQVVVWGPTIEVQSTVLQEIGQIFSTDGLPGSAASEQQLQAERAIAAGATELLALMSEYGAPDDGSTATACFADAAHAAGAEPAAFESTSLEAYFGSILGGAPPSLTEFMLGNVNAELFDDTLFGIEDASAEEFLVDMFLAALGVG
ncbi:MAG TPA: RHS repeat-associated core domain-containing protein [Mycobacteriales bacterium]|nr:RHS repeat-associated core domain-containing protein [Mycobacteriales bacterium]